MDSQDLQEIETHSPAEMAESMLGFPGARLLHPAEPSWWEWRARWDSGGDFIEVAMSLFEDEAESWGGSSITADCSLDGLMVMWSHLQARHRGVWLHAPDCTIHTPGSLRLEMAARP